MLNGTTLVEALSLPYSYENLDKKSYVDEVTDSVTIDVSNEVADGLTLKAETKPAVNDKIDVELEVSHEGLNPLVSKTDTDVVVTATIKGMPPQSLSCDVPANVVPKNLFRIFSKLSLQRQGIPFVG